MPNFKRPRPRQPPESVTPIKLIFQLYQCLHHLAFAKGDAVTAGDLKRPGKRPTRPRRRPFALKVDELDRLIRPALPHIDSGFHKRCHEINLKWQEDHIRNLQDHYNDSKCFISGQISSWSLPTAELTEHLKKARQWANNHFRLKFQPKSFKTVEDLVKSYASDFRPPTQNQPLPRTSNPAAQKQTYSKATAKPPPQTNNVPDKPTPATKNISPPETPRSVKSTTAPKVNKTLVRNPPSTPRKRTLSLGDSPTNKQTPKKNKTTAPRVKDTPVTPSLSTPSRKRVRHLSLGSSSPTEKKTPKKTKPSESPEKDTTRPKPREENGVTKFQKLPQNTFGQKVSNFWYIPQITKDIVVLGTSNLARITRIGRMDTQVMSFPGLKLQTLLFLLTNFRFGPGSKDGVKKPHKPKHVILAIGINDRHLAKTSNSVMIRKIVQEAKKKFEGCKISLYMNRYSPELPQNERDALRDLNGEIEKQCESQGLNLITPVPSKSFKVNSQDHIHWTESCANATISHMIDTAFKSDVHNVSSNSPTRGQSRRSLN